MFYKIIKNIQAAHRIQTFFFSVDETTDPLGKYIVNIIVGKLNADSPSKLYL